MKYFISLSFIDILIPDNKETPSFLGYSLLLTLRTHTKLDHGHLKVQNSYDTMYGGMEPVTINKRIFSKFIKQVELERAKC